METRKNISTGIKRIYMHPEIISIKLDNEISLALESTPPVGPDEGLIGKIDSFKNEPFRTLDS